MAKAISAEANEDLKEMDLLPRIHIMADLSRENGENTENQRNGGTICPNGNPAYWSKDLPATSKMQFLLYTYS